MKRVVYGLQEGAGFHDSSLWQVAVVHKSLFLASESCTRKTTTKTAI